MKKLIFKTSKLGNPYHCWINSNNIKAGDWCYKLDIFILYDTQQHKRLHFAIQSEKFNENITYVEKTFRELSDHIGETYSIMRRDIKLNQLLNE
jgi:hypothetical protein